VTVSAPLTRIQQRPAWPAASPRQFEWYEWRRRCVGTLVIGFCPTLGGVRRLFDDRGFGGSYISRAFENHVVDQLSCDKNPSAPVLRAGKESAVGQSVDVSLAAGKQHRSLLGVSMTGPSPDIVRLALSIAARDSSTETSMLPYSEACPG